MKPAALLFAWASSVLAAAAMAAAPAAPTPPDATSPAALAERMGRWRAELPQGTGPHRVVRVIEADNPDYTVYRPADLARSGKLPVVAFANGACRNVSTEYAGFLSELASHGYLVVAVGRDDNAFDIGPDSPPAGPNGRPLQVMDVKSLTRAVDWAIARNDDAASLYRGRLQPTRIAYMGHSCGGMQALTASADPRTTTTVVLNSGYYRTPPARPPGPLPEYRRWSELHAPTALFTGGPKDVAYRIARDSYEDGVAAGLPMFLASLPTLAHSGAYVGPDREWSRAVVAWLDWQLKGDAKAREQFVGERCGLCTNASWQDVASHDLALPRGIHPVSLSRLPPLARAELDAEGKATYDRIVGAAPAPTTGPVPLSLYSPKIAQVFSDLNGYLRYNGALSPRHTEVAILVASWEIEQQYEYSAHEPAALRYGAPQAVIDTIKYDRAPIGLSAEETLIIRLGRAILRDHFVDRGLYAEVEKTFGRRGLVELVTVMGDYVMVGMIMTTIDQQLPPDRPALLPKR